MDRSVEAATSDRLTDLVAEFSASCVFDDIPVDVMHLGKKSILDGLGPALCGAKTEGPRMLREYLSRSRAVAAGVPTATVFGCPDRLAVADAALANGMAMHADDYDDTMQAATGKFQGIHPTAPVFSAVMAVAETGAYSGKELLTAYHVGVEIACKLFDATAPEHILNGYHATGTCGLLGAAVAVARLKGLDADTTRTALGIAASHSGGLQENFGTMTKPYHAGRSARDGIAAAELAEMGFTASQAILEAPRGFFMSHGGGWEAERIVDRIGAPWSFVDRGIWLKPWPTGSLSHPAMTLMRKFVVENDLKLEDVASIRLRTSENIHKTLLHHHPKTELEAKFSLEFVTAALLVERDLGLAHFTDEFVRSSAVQRAVGLVDYETFDEAHARAEGYTIVTSFVEIALNDERVLSGRLDYGKGSKANPMSDDEVEAKFRDCATFAGVDGERAEAICQAIWQLEDFPDARSLSRLLAYG